MFAAALSALGRNEMRQWNVGGVSGKKTKPFSVEMEECCTFRLQVLPSAIYEQNKKTVIMNIRDPSESPRP